MGGIVAKGCRYDGYQHHLPRPANYQKQPPKRHLSRLYSRCDGFMCLAECASMMRFNRYAGEATDAAALHTGNNPPAHPFLLRTRQREKKSLCCYKSNQQIWPSNYINYVDGEEQLLRPIGEQVSPHPALCNRYAFSKTKQELPQSQVAQNPICDVCSCRLLFLFSPKAIWQQRKGSSAVLARLQKYVSKTGFYNYKLLPYAIVCKQQVCVGVSPKYTSSRSRDWYCQHT